MELNSLEGYACFAHNVSLKHFHYYQSMQTFQQIHTKLLRAQCHSHILVWAHGIFPALSAWSASHTSLPN